MNRKQFMSQLKERLQRMPFDEVRQAVDYYEQYFDEAGPENEAAVIAELGSPAHVASQIIGDFALKGPQATPPGEQPQKRGLSTVWMVVLAIVASPIALPIVAVVLALAIALFAIIFSVMVSILAVGAALLAASIVCFLMLIPVIGQSFASFLFLLGVALISLGLGSAVLVGGIKLSNLCVNALAGGLGQFLKRRGTK